MIHTNTIVTADGNSILISGETTLSSVDQLQLDERRSTNRQNISVLQRKGLQPKRYILSFVEHNSIYDNICQYESLVGKLITLNAYGLTIMNLLITEASFTVGLDSCSGLHTLQINLSMTQSVEVKPQDAGPVRLY